MIIGDKKIFAIELEISSDPGPASFLGGFFTYWINQEKISQSYREEIYLMEVLAMLLPMLKANRESSFFEDISDEEIFKKLNELLYLGENFSDDYTSIIEKNKLFRFDINVLNIDQKYKTFLIDKNTYSLILMGDHESKGVPCIFKIPKGYFNEVAKGACTQILKWSKELV